MEGRQVIRDEARSGGSELVRFDTRQTARKRSRLAGNVSEWKDAGGPGSAIMKKMSSPQM